MPSVCGAIEGQEVIFDVGKWLRDFRISHRPLDGRGWLHIDCPFCPGVPDGHLGYHPETGRWNCWRCGGKRWEQVVKALSGLGPEEVIARYGKTDSRPLYGALRAIPKREPGRKEALLPLSCGPIEKPHHAYLHARRFDPETMAREWGLLGTGPVGPDKLRIIAPVVYQGRLVTWQGRDITGKAKAKYRACPPEMEAKSIKKCLYGLDKVDPNKGCVVVEGITDVWRLGPGAVATFGTKWMPAQAHLLKGMKRVFLLFDSGEEAAARFSAEFCSTLTAMGVAVEKLDLEESGDPADLSQTTADAYMRELNL